jgi:predicted metal-binding membrane protein
VGEVSVVGETARSGSPASTLHGLRRGQLVVLGLLLALAALGWLVSDLRMAGMDAGPGTDPGAFGFYVTTWVVMMAAMMFPSIAPMVLTYRRLQARRGVGAASTAMFVGGYLLVWAASGLVAYAVLKAGRSLDGGLFSWHRAGRWVAAGVLATAALYEFTPLKQACLTRCRSPLGFLLGSWREGPDGAFRMGVEHGGWCLGCCWFLMVGLFALGAMSITWMIVITLLIGLEKLLAHRLVGTGAVAGVLAALALGVAAFPQHVPGLTIPGSRAAMRAMDAMDGSTHGMTGSMQSMGGSMQSVGGSMQSVGGSMQSMGGSMHSNPR